MEPLINFAEPIFLESFGIAANTGNNATEAAITMENVPKLP